MPTISIVREVDLSRSIRCQQLDAIFDVPPQDKCRLEWKGDLPIDDGPWNVGLIVGPSGSGKSTIAKEVFGEAYNPPMTWGGRSIVDDFRVDLSIEKIIDACSAVGFKTIPAWMRPYEVLSTGEKFRVEIARRLIELDDPIVVDEFTSVVDRQVAKIGAYAIQKYIRKNNRKFVAVTCHYDVIEWLMPDWIFEPGTMTYKPRGCLQRSKRPDIEVEIKKVPWDTWTVFAPFHYLTKELHRGAQCFGLFVDGRITTFAGVLHVPNKSKSGQNIKRVSRGVTLPDWQGLGLMFVLNDTLAQAYKALGFRLRLYPNHPPLIRSMQRMGDWRQTKEAGYVQKTKKGVHAKLNPDKVSRPCAVFEYCGPAMDRETASKLIHGEYAA